MEKLRKSDFRCKKNHWSFWQHHESFGQRHQSFQQRHKIFWQRQIAFGSVIRSFGSVMRAFCSFMRAFWQRQNSLSDCKRSFSFMIIYPYADACTLYIVHCTSTTDSFVPSVCVSCTMYMSCILNVYEKNGYFSTFPFSPLIVEKGAVGDLFSRCVSPFLWTVFFVFLGVSHQFLCDVFMSLPNQKQGDTSLTFLFGKNINFSYYIL